MEGQVTYEPPQSQEQPIAGRPWARRKVLAAGGAALLSAACSPGQQVGQALRVTQEATNAAGQAVQPVVEKGANTAQNLTTEVNKRVVPFAKETEQKVMDSRFLSRIVDRTVTIDGWEHIFPQKDALDKFWQYFNRSDVDVRGMQMLLDPRDNVQMQYLTELGKRLEDSGYMQKLVLQHQGKMRVKVFPNNEQYVQVQGGNKLYMRDIPEFRAKMVPGTEYSLPGQKLPIAFEVGITYPATGDTEVFGIPKRPIEPLPDVGTWGFLPYRTEFKSGATLAYMVPTTPPQFKP